MKSVNEVLSYFIETLEQEKQFKFDMAHWYSEHGNVLSKPFEIENVCGTTACIAGSVAYRLDPKSLTCCCVDVVRWIGFPVDTDGNYDGTDEKEEALFDDVDSALDAIFTNPDTYGVWELTDVTKDEAIERLKELRSKFETWEDLREALCG